LNALIRRVEKPQGEWRSADSAAAPEIGADNGSKVMNSPGFGFETEPSEEPSVERVREETLAWKRRGRSGVLTS
jgi:hypothetical protein